MGCIQSPAPQSPSFQHVKTQSGAVYIANDVHVPSVIWEYLEDINSANWQAYETNNCRQIHVAYSTNAKKCQICNKAGDAYEIDFDRMTETNVVNGWQRKVRIQPNDDIMNDPLDDIQNTNTQYHKKNNNHLLSASPIKSKSFNSPSPHNHSHNHSHMSHGSKVQQSISSYTVSPKHQNDINPLLIQHDLQHDINKHAQPVTHKYNKIESKFKWQWFSETIGWKDYDDKLSYKIDEAYVENIARYAFKIRSNNTKYEIDFDRMKQCNLDTSKLRTIRRVTLDEPSGHTSSHSHNNNNGYVNANEERFVWEYYNDMDGLWYEYNDNVSLKIETVHHSNASVARMKIHGIEFEIRLNEMPMNQCNLKTGKIAQLRRMVKKGHNKRMSTAKNNVISNALNSPKHSAKNIKKFQWRYKEGINIWKIYPTNLNTKIENAFRAELERYTFTMNGQQYEIQFNFLRMVNLQTNEKHEIARIDNLAKNRSPSMFNQPVRPKQMNVNNTHRASKTMNANVMKQAMAKPKKKKHAVRSYTVDMSSPKESDNNFDILIKQQQKAMKYFNKQHEKKKSSMSLNLAAYKNEFNAPEIVDRVHVENKQQQQPQAQAQAQINEKQLQSIQNQELIDDFVWKYKNDNGTWSTYTPAISGQMETAYQSGQETIEIEKNGIFYQIQLERNLECHFATNKMRPIQRVELNNGIPNTEINEEFDALSNNLESFASDKHKNILSNRNHSEQNMVSDYDEHEDEEKDDEYQRNKTMLNITPQIPQINNDDNETDDSDEDDDEEEYESDDTDNEDEEDESYDEQESDDDDDDDDEEDEEDTQDEQHDFEPQTPADSEFAAKDYGNDYNEYMQKFESLKRI